MMNIVVPMAGAGARFTQAGYITPKPFIEVAGRPMIEVVLENLTVDGARFILIVRSEHLAEYMDVFDRLRQRYEIVLRTSDILTEGPASTVFLAADYVNTDEPLLIANSDQLVDISISDYIGDSDTRGLDGSILTFPSADQKWSYAAIDDTGIVTDVKEKVVISPHATVGIYYFLKGTDFVTAAALMMGKNERVNNEFYVGPAYNQLIAMGKRIGIFGIAAKQMHGLGTPDDLNEYLAKTVRTSA